MKIASADPRRPARAARRARRGRASSIRGLYDISATDQHLRADLLAARRRRCARSVERGARRTSPCRRSATPAQLERGLALFRAHCVQCHGAPGRRAGAVRARPDAAAPTTLAHTGARRTPAELFWVVKNGIKMTGMPAWEFRMADDELWAVVAFLQQLPLAVAGPNTGPRRPPRAVAARRASARRHARAKRGKRALEQYACVTCHDIPGIVGPKRAVGPTARTASARASCSAACCRTRREHGALAARAAGLHHRTARCPILGVTERDARDMAAYLATLK